jgi:group I intron endonuclease
MNILFIYKTINLINNKIYIGKCARIKNNKNYFGSGRLILLAIKKYGKINFKREIIEDNIDNEYKLNEREIYWIKFYNSTDLEIGYNFAKGGEGGDITERKGKNHEEIYGKEKSQQIKNSISKTTSGSSSYWYGKNLSEDTKNKISKSKKGKKHTEEAKKKMSENHPITSGSYSPLFGTHLSDEQKTHLSKVLKGKSLGRILNNKTKKNISDKAISRKNKGNFSSKYVGVSLNKKENMWRSAIKPYGENKKIILGNFYTEIEAAIAYNEAAIEYYGWKIKDRLNIINEQEYKNIWEINIDIKKAKNSKLDISQIAEIKMDINNNILTISEIGKKFNVSSRYIKRIKSGETWSWLQDINEN